MVHDTGGARRLSSTYDAIVKASSKDESSEETPMASNGSLDDGAGVAVKRDGEQEVVETSNEEGIGRINHNGRRRRLLKYQPHQVQKQNGIPLFPRPPNADRRHNHSGDMEMFGVEGKDNPNDYVTPLGPTSVSNTRLGRQYDGLLSEENMELQRIALPSLPSKVIPRTPPLTGEEDGMLPGKGSSIPDFYPNLSGTTLARDNPSLLSDSPGEPRSSVSLIPRRSAEHEDDSAGSDDPRSTQYSLADSGAVANKAMSDNVMIEESSGKENRALYGACCGNLTVDEFEVETKTSGGMLMALLENYIPECLQTDQVGATLCSATVQPDEMLKDSKGTDTPLSLSKRPVAPSLPSAEAQTFPSQIHPVSLEGAEQSQSTHADEMMGLGMSMWLKDMDREYKTKEQSRTRMVAAMATAARAHSQLLYDDENNDEDDYDEDLASRSLDFDDLGQLGGFGKKKRSRSTSMLFRMSHTQSTGTQNIAQNGQIGNASTSYNFSDYDSDDHSNGDLHEERELVLRARQMREEIRNAEMVELAEEAERAAEAGKEKFCGSASTFDVVLAANTATSKKEDRNGKEPTRNGKDLSWERMFDETRRSQNISSQSGGGLGTPPSSPLREWVKDTLAATPSSPVGSFVSNAVSIYQPSTPLKSGVMQRSPARSTLKKDSVQKALGRRASLIADSYYPTTPLRRAATASAEATGSLIMSAISTPLAAEWNSFDKVSVLELRHIEDVIPSFGKLHMRLRTDMAGRGVSQRFLESTSAKIDGNMKDRDAMSDHRSAIGSDGSASSLQHIAVSLRKLLKSATSPSNGPQIASNATVPPKLPPSAKPRLSDSGVEETALTDIVQRSSLFSDCARSLLQVKDADQARNILKEQVRDDSPGEDDNSIASQKSNSTTDLYVSTLTSELHSPTSASRRRKKFAKLNKAPSMDDIPSTDVLASLETDQNGSPSSGAVLLISTPRGGSRTYKRRESGGFVQEAPGPSLLAERKGRLPLEDSEILAVDEQLSAEALSRVHDHSHEVFERPPITTSSHVSIVSSDGRGTSLIELLPGESNGHSPNHEAAAGGYIGTFLSAGDLVYCDSDVDSEVTDTPIPAASILSGMPVIGNFKAIKNDTGGIYRSLFVTLGFVPSSGIRAIYDETFSILLYEAGSLT